MANPVQITAANQWTDEIPVTKGKFSLSIFPGSAAFVGTITVQRKRKGAVSTTNPWRDVKTYTAVTEETGEMPGEWVVRAGCAAGNYTSGNVYVEVSE